VVRILVVDDEGLARFAIKEILEEQGHDVEEAENGLQAIEYQNAAPYDLVITDVIR